MNFAYTAKSTNGQMASGVLTADSTGVARQQLREQGLFVISIKPAAAQTSAGSVSRRSLFAKRVSQKDLMSLTSHLAIMARSGIDIAGALQSVARHSTHPALKKTLEAVHTDVMGGRSVSAALGSHPDVFDRGYVATIAAGEASGQLPEVLGRLADMLRAELRLRGMRRAMLAYPIVLTVVSTLVVLGLIFFVLPQFSGIFAQFDMPLPPITRLLLAVSAEMKTRWWLWPVLIVAGIFALRALLRSSAGRRCWDQFMLNMVLVRDVTRSLSIGRAFRLLGIMIQSGVPLLEGLRLTRSSLHNSLLRELFDNLEHDVLNGQGLAASLSTAKFLPAGATEMISTGERTGTLGTVTQVMGEFYEEEGETRLRELATLVEPLIIIVMGVVVAVIVLSVMLPMFDLATFAQHRD